MSYESFYNLKEAPFFNIPDERFFFKAPQYEKAIIKISHAIKRRMGLCVVTGGIGSGKTMLSRKILELLNPDYFESSLIVMVHTEVSPKWFLKKIIMQLGVKTEEDDKMVLLSLLYNRLREIANEGRIPVVLIDEANMIQNKQFFEEVRGLLNFENAHGKLLNFIFFGLNELKENMRMDLPLSQRVAMAVELRPMDERTTFNYIRFRLAVAGAQRPIFDADAISAIYKYSGGVPRIINTICDNALLEGFIEKKEIISAQVIENTVADLGLITKAR